MGGVAPRTGWGVSLRSWPPELRLEGGSPSIAAVSELWAGSWAQSVLRRLWSPNMLLSLAAPAAALRTGPEECVKVRRLWAAW